MIISALRYNMASGARRQKKTYMDGIQFQFPEEWKNLTILYSGWLKDGETTTKTNKKQKKTRRGNKTSSIQINIKQTHTVYLIVKL